MEELIKMVMQQFGMDQRNAHSIMASLFKMLQQLMGDQFGNLANAIPGAKDWLNSPEVTRTQAPDSKGIIPIIMEILLGKKSVAFTDWIKLASKAGLNLQSAQALIVMVLKYAQQFMGKEGLSKALGGAPQLASLLNAMDDK